MEKSSVEPLNRESDIKHLRIATDAAGVALWSWNVDTDEINMDDRGFELWGETKRDKITFADLSSHIHTADRDRVAVAFNATRAHLGAYELDFRINVIDRACGSGRWRRRCWGGAPFADPPASPVVPISSDSSA
jgi:PAS domain-containing protein